MAEGAVVFYGVNNANDTNNNPLGISFGANNIGSIFEVDYRGGLSNSTFETNSPNSYFTQGTDITSGKFYRGAAWDIF